MPMMHDAGELHNKLNHNRGVQPRVDAENQPFKRAGQASRFLEHEIRPNDKGRMVWPVAPQQYGKVLHSTQPAFADYTTTIEQRKPEVKEYDYGQRAAEQKKKDDALARRMKTMTDAQRLVLEKQEARLEELKHALTFYYGGSGWSIQKPVQCRKEEAPEYLLVGYCYSTHSVFSLWHECVCNSVC
jgi:hypothetical protein